MKNLSLEALLEQLQTPKPEVLFEGVEFKQQWRVEHGSDISAIANHTGVANGWLVIGIEDTGKPAGKNLDWAKKVEEVISGQIRHYLSPSWAVREIVVRQVGTSHCIFIEIQNPGDVVKWDDKAYKLVGTTSHQMKAHEMLELSLRLPGADFSKTEYSSEIDPALVLAFAQKVVEAGNSEFHIDTTAQSPKEILKLLNIDRTAAAGVLFGNFPYRVVHFDADGDILDQKQHRGLFRILSSAGYPNLFR